MILYVNLLENYLYTSFILYNTESKVMKQESREHNRGNPLHEHKDVFL